VADKPCEITVTDDALWVVTQSGVVERVDPGGPAGPKVVASVPTGFASYQAAEAFGSIWVTNGNGQSLTRIAPATNQAGTVDLPGVNAGGVVSAGGALWVGDDTTGSTRVVRVDPETRATKDVDVGCDRPAYLAATADTVWVSCVKSGRVVAVDAATSATTGEPVPAGASPVNLHASPDGRWVWVPDDQTDLLTRIDTATGTAVERVVAGDGPAVVAPTDDAVWVTNFEDGTVWRLDTASA
jgi:streptogramin lyase